MSLPMIPTIMSGAWRNKMEFATKIIYLGLLLVYSGFFYFKGFKDGSIKTCDNLIKFIAEYDKSIKRSINNEKY